MKEYRKRFVQLNMLLIGFVLTLMVAVIAVYMYRDYYHGLQATMQQVVEPLDQLSQQGQQAPGQPGGPAAEPPAKPEGGQAPAQSEERPKDIMTVFYTPGISCTVLSRTALFEGDTLAEVLEAVTAQESDFGTLAAWNVIYYRTGSGAPYKIALASTGYILHSMAQLLLALGGVWAAAMLCFLLVSIRLSKTAVRPFEEAMQREKQFVADASHDLKTPLSVILANNSILLENPQASIASVEKWLRSTQAAAKNMQALIGEMLTLADAERTNAPLQTQMINAASVVTKAALQLESLAYEKNVALETELPEQVMLRTNADYLERVAASLAENAIKYEPGGGRVTVRLTALRRKVRLEVQNQCSVIAAEDLPHVFDRFYRSDKSRRAEADSHGLGLAIARQMVQRLGGQLQVSSSAENGTVFYADFPAAE